MIDLDSMIVSMSLSWVKKVFSYCGGTWKSYLIHDFRTLCGLNCSFLIEIITFTILCFLLRPLGVVDAIQRYF